MITYKLLSLIFKSMEPKSQDDQKQGFSVPQPSQVSQGSPLYRHPESTTPTQEVKPEEPISPLAPKPVFEESNLKKGDIVPPAPKRKLPKFLFPLFAALLLFFIVFLVIKMIIPRLKGQAIKEIVWWGLWEDEVIIKPLIEEYEGKNPGVKIKYVKNSPQDYRERLTNALAKGEGPDIFRFHNTWVPMFANELDNIPASFMGAGEYAQVFYPVITSDLSSGAGLVGVPIGYDALTLFINEEIFEKENLNPPTTWIELRDIAKRLTKVENGRIVQAGVALGRTENVDHWPEILGLMLLQNQVNLSRPQGKLAEDALKFFTLFSLVDGVWDETLPPSTVYFASGKLAMYFGPSWRAFNFKEQNPDLRFKTVSLPQLPKEKETEPNFSYATYWVEGVWERSKNKELAWDFLKFVASRNSLENFFKKASNTRGFGEAYPRADMRELLLDHPILGSIVRLAPEARSWYLASRTFDGPTGINSQINKYFEDAINAINEGMPPTKALEPVTQGVTQVLSQYGLVKK